MSKKGRIFLFILTVTLLLAGFAPKAFAVNVPNFPLCSNPQGDIVVSYDSGIHGVVGDTSEYSGKDTVYSINENQLVQCLCTDSGSGIQTSWWKVSSLTEEEINILKSQGWVLVPDGSAWGLATSAYLAKNANFSCNVSETNGGGSGGGDGRSDGRTDSLGCLNTDCSNQQRQALGMSTGVLGLATTGSYVFILGVILTGFLFLLSGLFLGYRKG